MTKQEKLYFEFNNHEYYALIAVDVESTYHDALEKSYEKYLHHVGGDSLQQIKSEGEPDVVSESYAIVAFAKSLVEHEPETLNKDMLKQFHESELILIAGSLL